MKAITIHVSEPVYEAYKEIARREDRSAAELIREAMERYQAELTREETSLLDLAPASVGKIIKNPTAGEDLLEEMLDENRS